MKKAFTLAEVLITLGIIGIVAVLTMPVLVANYQKKVIVTRMHKFYSAFNQALKLSEIDNGEISTWKFGTLYNKASNVIFYETYLKDYFKVIKQDTYYEMKMPIHGVRLFLADGSAVLIDNNWVNFYPVANKTAKMGKDVFSFNITANGLLPEGHGLSRGGLLLNCKEGTPNISAGSWCSALIMNDGWKIKDDYPW
jgi:prepilin-type N-terminal cleavage/methylation domain-containing protein